MFRLTNLIKFEFILTLIALAYYLYFVNKGLVFFDEGYFLHSAERIFNGETPYKDFSLQYGPTFFYILAFLYQVFGPFVIVGRFLSLGVCMLCIVFLFLILNKLKVKSYLTIFLAFLSFISFGFPLINIPNIMWLNVLSAEILVLIFIHWTSDKKISKLFLLGLFLGLSLSFKQNFGIAFVVLFNILVVLGEKRRLSTLIRNLFILNSVWLLITASWVYFFFLKDNFRGLIEFISFSQRFAKSTAFSYPTLAYLFQPTGFFKLLPYYLPIALLLIILLSFFRKNQNLKVIAFSLTCTVGFFVSIFPQSDLLHCYPFLGMILVSFLLFDFKGKVKILSRIIVVTLILIGFYLTFFTKSYRYENYFYNYDTYVNLPRAHGILITKDDSKSLSKLSAFINSKTTRKDYIFAYPTAPMLYFLLERSNPSKDPIYFLPSWHFYSDEFIISELKSKNVRYVVTYGTYIYDAKLSGFIQEHKSVFKSGQFQVFEVVNN